MPRPRLFETPSDQRERWSHVLGCLIGLSSAETRPALIAELAGEDLPDADAAQTRLATRAGDWGVDILVRDRQGRWAVAIQTTLGWDVASQIAAEGALTALASSAERVIGVVICPDRKPSSAIEAARANGFDVRHKSWLRVRDWVQERPERGGSTGVDAALLREAEYFFTPRVAELYRLEEVMGTIDADLRPVLSSVYFDLNDLSIAPLMTHPSTGVSQTRITFPRTGDAGAEILVADGALSVRVRGTGMGGGFTGDGDWSQLELTGSDTWTANRSEAVDAARAALPVPR